MNADDVIHALMCPIDWGTITENREAANWFYFLWVVKVRNHERDCESSLFTRFDDDYQPDQIEIGELDNTELRTFGHNNFLWATTARKEYIEECRRFSEITCCGPDRYRKHYVSSDLTDEEVRLHSVGKAASFLLPRFDVIQQYKLLWNVLGRLIYVAANSDERVEHFEEEWELATQGFWDVYGKNNLRIYVEIPCKYKLGAVNGVLTNFCCFDIDFSTPQFHTFPVLQEEFTEAQHHIYTDTYWLESLSSVS